MWEYTHIFYKINPCPAEFFQLYFLSFEARIADAISSFKWRKKLYLLKIYKIELFD